jgi:hypothetical protein
MPGQLDETRAVLHFVAEELGPGCYVNLMAQYYPSGRVGRNGEYAVLDRRLHREEYEQAPSWGHELGLRLDRAVSATGTRSPAQASQARRRRAAASPARIGRSDADRR